MSSFSDPLPSTDTAASTATPPFAFKPPPGGDINLISCDGTIFRVHSVMLGLSSAVFEDMLGGPDTKSDTVGLAEDAEAISLMLAFIYPTTLPSISNVDILEKAMLVAQKYDIRRITELIESLFQSDNQLLTLDPIHVFGASAKYGFDDIRIMAAKFLCLNSCNLLSIEGLKGLVRALPDTPHVVGLIGALSLRMKVLDELLLEKPLALGLYPSWQTRPRHGDNMSCSDCWRRWHISGTPYYRPGWYHVWALRLRAALLQKPVNSCEGYFNISCISEFQSREPEACEYCVSATMSKGPIFNAWGEHVKSKVQDALEALDTAYSI